MIFPETDAPGPRSDRDRIGPRFQREWWDAAGAPVGRLRAWAEEDLSDRFRVLSPLTPAGYWILFQAEKPAEERPVVLGIRARGDLSGEEERLLARNGCSERCPSHPAVLCVERCGVAGRLVWFQCPRATGERLGDRLERRGPRTLARGLELLRVVGEALDHGHRGGLVHGGLSPWTVLVGPPSEALILNWGMDLPVLRARRKRGEKSGIPARFMAPELLRGEEGGPAADQYALALLLQETLGSPLGGESGSDPVPDPFPVWVQSGGHVSRKALAPGARKALVRALQPDPEFRHPDVATFVRTFCEAVEREEEIPIEDGRSRLGRGLGVLLREHLGEEGSRPRVVARKAESGRERQGAVLLVPVREGGDDDPAPEASPPGRGRLRTTTGAVVAFAALLGGLVLFGSESAPGSGEDEARGTLDRLREARSVAERWLGGVEAPEVSWAPPGRPGDLEGEASSTSARTGSASPDELPILTDGPFPNLGDMEVDGARTSPGSEASRDTQPDPTPREPEGDAPATRTPELRPGDAAPARADQEESPANPEPRALPPSPPPVPGSLYVNSYPWGIVSLNGTRLGTTPVVDHSLPPGVHILRIEREGFEPHVEEIRVEPGGQLRKTRIVLTRRDP